ncbi:filamentation induced by cAMP protein Fic [methanotrophic bacterial endosymbiont of Bathymodiolus sp.]|nr:filamentation induced by cAMP protein Fic [methanotrophic bacterial endosymbiont of Bathymodiolus sp.]
MTHIKLLLQRVDVLKAKLDQHRDWQRNEILEALNIEYTYDSNRIEGNTLTLRETDLVIHKGLTIGGKPMNEHLEAINHYEAINFIRDLVKSDEPFNQHNLLSIHGLILQGIDRLNAGRFRQVPVMISGSQHTPPQPWQIDKLMEDYFLFYQQNRESLHPVILAAELHERLATIHPFIDGNGRTARLVMNLILLQSGYPIANISGETNARLAYYNTLEKCNLEQDKAEFHALIIDYVIAALERLLLLVE